MGVPVAPRNIFPSNIQGLPTWYEVRVSEAGHMGARGGTDLMVAMNPQTFDKDIAGIEPGGYLFYDSTKPLPPSKFRDDITVVGVPLTAICNREYTDPRQRQLFKNIIYIGVLTALLDMTRLWAIVLAANLAGTLFAALFCAFTPVLQGEIYNGMLEISRDLLAFSWWEMVFRAIAAGFLMAAMSTSAPPELPGLIAASV